MPPRASAGSCLIFHKDESRSNQSPIRSGVKVRSGYARRGILEPCVREMLFLAPNWHGASKSNNWSQREEQKGSWCNWAAGWSNILGVPDWQTDRTDRVVAVEKAVAVVMQESGRRALFDATQRLGANYREKAGLIKSVTVGRLSMCEWLLIVGVGANCIFCLVLTLIAICQQ